MDASAHAWAEEEFGAAALGHGHRTKRLVKMAADVARSPSGHITTVFRDGARREGAFRFVENPDVDPRVIVDAAASAAARRARAYSYVYVPIDGTSLSIADANLDKGTGVVGSRFNGARGFHVLDSIVVAPDGAPLGLAHVEFWTRHKPVPQRANWRHEKAELKETRFWHRALDRIRQTFASHAPNTTPWFQLDRGADAWTVLDTCIDNGLTVTVRSTHNRGLWRDRNRARRYLHDELLRSPVRGTTVVEIPARGKRVGRTAQLSVRFADVVLDLHTHRGRHRHPVKFSAVHVREVRPPKSEKRIEWFLLTTWPVEDFDDAITVIDGYAARWTIEEFHRVWKSGACAVETTQLRAADHIERWSVILAAVSVRILRLIKLARTEPDLPATVEFNPSEIKAILVTNKKCPPDRGPTIAEAVTWLAEIGGYTGKSSGGPPGATVLKRGLDRIQLLVDYLDAESDEKN